LAAVSPAVVVPSMLRISKWGYGVRSGVPTVVIAASAIDDVYAITGFGAFISAAFSKELKVVALEYGKKQSHNWMNMAKKGKNANPNQ
uniref:CDP-alcohol phosphatidyltransferase family protein n=1 Tax=Anisakis simplex TaxID=6269 RepID=A0A0M3JDQ4_ANISI